MGLFNWLKEHHAARVLARERDRYERELTKWRNEATELENEIEFANEPTGFTGTSEAIPTVLRKGEAVFLVANGAALVEPKRLPGQWVGGYQGLSFRIMKGVRYHVGGSRGQYLPGREVETPIAQGTVTITNQRVVFQSDKEAREWAFSKLIGYQHDPRIPMTYFQVSNRKKVSAIAYDVKNSRVWRFRLALALAHFRGEVPSLLADLKKEAELHEAAKPKPPLQLQQFPNDLSVWQRQQKQS